MAPMNPSMYPNASLKRPPEAGECALSWTAKFKRGSRMCQAVAKFLLDDDPETEWRHRMEADHLAHSVALAKFKSEFHEEPDWNCTQILTQHRANEVLVFINEQDRSA